MTRGLVVSLTPDQVVTRALYLAGERTVHDLDEHVLVRTDSPEQCPTIWYRLKGFNGGKDPRATHPADVWSERDESGIDHLRITCDCAGGAAWCSGYDRYQPQRFAHLYDGWVNTDSMLMDAHGKARCFVDVGRPELGTMIVCKSGSRGHKIGHVGVVVSVPAEWDASERECWDAIGVVDVAGRTGRANMRTTGRGWFATGAGFLRSAMKP